MTITINKRDDEYAIDWCDDDIIEYEREIKGLKKDIKTLKKFINSDIGIEIAKFCEENKKRNGYDKKKLRRIEKMIPHCDFDISIYIERPASGERMYGYVEGNKFHLKLSTASLRYYLFDNFDPEDDIKRIKKLIKRYKKEIDSLKGKPFEISINELKDKYDISSDWRIVDMLEKEKVLVDDYDNYDNYDDYDHYVTRRKIIIYTKNYISKELVNIIKVASMYNIETEIIYN